MISLSKFLIGWTEHYFGTCGRSELNSSDAKWELLYKKLNDSDNIEDSNLSLLKETLLYRVHRGLDEEPNYEKLLKESGKDIAKAKERYEKSYEIWKEGKNIRFDDHWVSFTSSVDTIGSHQFGGKLLRGDVIVITSDKAIDISNAVSARFSAEHEVVAPLSEKNVVEVLPFKKFIAKYGQGTSDYENRKKFYND